MLKRCMTELGIDPKRYPPRAIRGLSERIAALENRVADLTGEDRPEAKVRELGQRKGRSSAGG